MQWDKGQRTHNHTAECTRQYPRRQNNNAALRDMLGNQPGTVPCKGKNKPKRHVNESETRPGDGHTNRQGPIDTGQNNGIDDHITPVHALYLPFSLIGKRCCGFTLKLADMHANDSIHPSI